MGGLFRPATQSTVMASPFVLCGLGNPGGEYADTRHNLGFVVADEVARRYKGRWSFPDDRFALARVSVAREDVLILKPLTFMNLSGQALEALGSRESFSPKRLMVVCDDIALPLGGIRLRRSGSDGGHNGLASVIQRLGTNRFPRLRLGVGAPPEGDDPADYVLDTFTADEREVVAEVVRQAVKCVETWIDHGLDVAMNRFNRSPARDRRNGEHESD